MADVQEQQIRAHDRSRWRERGRIGLAALFAFMAFEALLFAAALQGPWLVLIAPAVVCGFKAAEIYRRTPDRTPPNTGH